MKRLCFFIVLLFSAVSLMAGNCETVVGNVDDRINAGRVEYQGVDYRPKRRITSILLMGVDQESGESERERGFRNGGQADFLLLLVLDDNAKTVFPILLNRDTMTDITALTSFGVELGSWSAQLCLAHSFGDGREQSCVFTQKAVSGLLMDCRVDHYCAMFLNGISVLNDMLGGVEVYLEDDFSIYDPDMISGTTVVLQGKQAEVFLRNRYGIGSQDNVSRMGRQKQYLENAKQSLEAKSNDNPAYVETLFNALEPFIVTDMGRGRSINLLDQARTYQWLPLRELTGEYAIGENGYVEFHADDSSIREIVIEAFYMPLFS